MSSIATECARIVSIYRLILDRHAMDGAESSLFRRSHVKRKIRRKIERVSKMVKILLVSMVSRKWLHIKNVYLYNDTKIPIWDQLCHLSRALYCYHIGYQLCIPHARSTSNWLIVNETCKKYILAGIIIITRILVPILYAMQPDARLTRGRGTSPFQHLFDMKRK